MAIRKSVVFNTTTPTSKDELSDMPRYVMEATYANGEMYWRYNPPKRAIDAGVTERIGLGTDRVKAWKKADDLNIALDTWMIDDSDHLRKTGMSQAPTVDGLVAKFLESRFYTQKGKSTQKDYKYFLSVLCDTEVKGVPLGSYKFKVITKSIASAAYDKWVAKGPFLAEHVRGSARRIWNLAENEWELLYHNPWKSLEPTKKPARKQKWTQDEITKFMEMAFSKHQWRNVGVIVLLAYELGQRLGDMRTLEWDEYIEHEKMIQFTSSKRGVDMELPLNEGLIDIFAQQLNKFGDTKYVAPHPKSGEHYTLDLLSKTGQRIREAAGLGKHLRMMDMRRTAVNEALDAGMDRTQIMEMTGHQHVASMNPYVVQNKERAKEVIKARKTLLTK